MNTPHRLTRRTFVGQLSLGAAALLLPSFGRSASAPEGRKLGVALVGLGSYSKGQLGPALRETQHCRLAGVVTGDATKGRRWSLEYGFPEEAVYSYDTMSRLADNPDIDIVYVVTPNALHAEHTIAAAKAGKHVICEKPMGISVAECDAMIAACKAAGRKLGMGYRLYQDPYNREMMRIVDEKRFGRATKMSGGFSFVNNRKIWRAERKLAGGGPLMDLGVYVIQAACMAAGGMPKPGGPYVAPVAVTAREIAKKRPEIYADVEETIEFTLEFENGLKAHGRTSYQESANDFRIEAERGWAELSPAYTYGPLAGRTSEGKMDFPRVNQQALQMDEFALSVKENRPSVVAGEMGRRDLAIIEAIYASAANDGQRTEVKA